MKNWLLADAAGPPRHPLPRVTRVATSTPRSPSMYIQDRWVFLYPGRTRVGISFLTIKSGSLDRNAVGSVTYTQVAQVLSLLRPDRVYVPHSGDIPTSPKPVGIPEHTTILRVDSAWLNYHKWVPRLVHRLGGLARRAYRMAVYTLHHRSDIALGHSTLIQFSMTLAETEGKAGLK